MHPHLLHARAAEPSTSQTGCVPPSTATAPARAANALVDSPEEVHVVVALIDCAKLTTNVDDGDVIPTARIRRIEAITDPQDGHRLRQLLRRQWERRTGQTVLPFDLEDDLRAAFGDGDAEAS